MNNFLVGNNLCIQYRKVTNLIVTFRISKCQLPKNIDMENYNYVSTQLLIYSNYMFDNVFFLIISLR